jgi:predicted HTH transcriptional regulator
MAQQNPLAEAEMVKVQGDIATKQMVEQNKAQQFMLKMQQEQQQFQQEMARKMTELELKHQVDIPGQGIEEQITGLSNEDLFRLARGE